MKEVMYRSAWLEARLAVGLGRFQLILNCRLGSPNLSLISLEAWSVTRVYYQFSKRGVVLTSGL
jgi:hypothetical protein